MIDDIPDLNFVVPLDEPEIPPPPPAPAAAPPGASAVRPVAPPAAAAGPRRRPPPIPQGYIQLRTAALLELLHAGNNGVTSGEFSQNPRWKCNNFRNYVSMCFRKRYPGSVYDRREGETSHKRYFINPDFWNVMCDWAEQMLQEEANQL